MVWLMGCGSSSGYVNQENFVPHIVEVSGGGQTANKGTAFAQPLGAKIAIDSAGVKIDGQQVFFKDPAGQYHVARVMANAWAHLDPTLAPPSPGTYTFTAGVDYSSTGAWPIQVTVVDNPATGLSAVPGYATSAATGTPFATSFQVKAVDASGLVVAGVPVTFQAPASGASCDLDGYGTSRTVATDAFGLATVRTVTANGTAGSYTITFTSGALGGSFSVSNL
ncbi:MAG TPA: hypothetical protein VJ600_08640 [Holophagaceae bacterium]|nr:hypothetical protein [Holophagaceae bacterium]